MWRILTQACRVRRDDGLSRARLQFELLEDRLVPAKAFAIEFTATALPDHIAHISGKVHDIDPPSVDLTFSGVVSGFAKPDANGDFVFITKATSLGMIRADGVNALDMKAVSYDALDVPRPVITLDISYVAQRTVTLSGSVEDVDPSGLVVSFKGVVKASTITDSSGKFSLTTDASGLGDVHATTVNDWGLRSERATVTVYSAPPKIINFQAQVSRDGVWTFSGTVVDEDPAGLVVHFSNIPELQGKTATVGSDGKFSLTLLLHLTEPAQVHADVSDWWGLAADPAWVDIYP
jgi:hypothetical protein